MDNVFKADVCKMEFTRMHAEKEASKNVYTLSGIRDEKRNGQVC